MWVMEVDGKRGREGGRIVGWDGMSADIRGRIRRRGEGVWKGIAVSGVWS